MIRVTFSAVTMFHLSNHDSLKERFFVKIWKLVSHLTQRVYSQDEWRFTTRWMYVSPKYTSSINKDLFQISGMLEHSLSYTGRSLCVLFTFRNYKPTSFQKLLLYKFKKDYPVWCSIPKLEHYCETRIF